MASANTADLKPKASIFNGFRQKIPKLQGILE